MRPEEVTDIINSLCKLNILEMDLKDQLAYMMAITQFAEKLKPLVIKYTDKLPEGSTFLFRL